MAQQRIKQGPTYEQMMDSLHKGSLVTFITTAGLTVTCRLTELREVEKKDNSQVVFSLVATGSEQNTARVHEVRAKYTPYVKYENEEKGELTEFKQSGP